MSNKQEIATEQEVQKLVPLTETTAMLLTLILWHLMPVRAGGGWSVRWVELVDVKLLAPVEGVRKTYA